MTGIVYVFTNPAMPGYVKIGKTAKSNVGHRLKTLSNPTGVPLPFECRYAAEVEDASKVEAAIHKAFAVDRKNPKREFFTTDPQRIITLLKMLEIADVTPATRQILDKITPPVDKATDTKSKSKQAHELKTKSWEEVVKSIGKKELREDLLAMPYVKENVNKLRATI